jgi:hypothetical protein
LLAKDVMRQFFLVLVVGLAAAFWSGSCQGPDEVFRNVGPAGTGTAGTVATGGHGGHGGSGAVGGAGAIGGGGAGATGGRAGTAGGAGAGGSGNRAGSGGTVGGAGAGGGGASGGRAGTSGGAGAGGHGGGTAGTMGVAGTTGLGGGAGGTGGSANCIDAIKLNNYSFGTTPPCSACKNNQTDESAKCEKTIDCEDAAFPCDAACQLNCRNTAVDDSVAAACASSLVSASCGS